MVNESVDHGNDVIFRNVRITFPTILQQKIKANSANNFFCVLL